MAEGNTHGETTIEYFFQDCVQEVATTGIRGMTKILAAPSLSRAFSMSGRSVPQRAVNQDVLLTLVSSSGKTKFDRGPRTLDFRTHYMGSVHEPERLLEHARRQLAAVDYDTLVGTGLSGAIAVTELARQLEKWYLVVRKPNDSSHSNLPVEGRLGERWLFVDDLIETGATARWVREKVTEVAKGANFRTEMVGAFLYADVWNSEAFYGPNSELMQSAFAQHWTDTELGMSGK
ncbi:hypothetical protein BST33_00130 [Mycolicibacter minnesotensis]|uniref:Orotate phosphoribosyltransferase n=2 Tax=Mycolicibacter minnesotensis TaxID=1118379 RepID=A0AA91RNQ7_9MYCO|nr:hypothetical protein BST33_00130 [Mycolicibacter minnesotensis]